MEARETPIVRLTVLDTYGCNEGKGSHQQGRWFNGKSDPRQWTLMLITGLGGRLWRKICERVASSG
jgi:hypothetical protein